uniref:hypothetical protein n=1 Tax=Arthrobacter silvisoli TaxID=2291022 RepID=UPI003F491222
MAEVDSVVDELSKVTARVTLTATYGQRASSGQAQHAPAPVNVDAVSGLDELHRWLMGVALRLAQDTRKQMEGRSHQAVSSWLIKHMPDLRMRNWCTTLHGELDKLLRECERITHEAVPRTFAGRCAEDDTELYAVKGEAEVRCRTCGTSYEVLKWRAHAQTAKDYYIGTPADLSRKLSAPQYGIEVTADQIRKWASRLTVARDDGTKAPKLQRANPETDDQGNPIPPAYRLGDVLNLVTQRHHKTPLEGRTA